MSELLVVRHGQASLFSDDYDVLSDLGREQAGRLGRAWQERGIRPGELVTVRDGATSVRVWIDEYAEAE